jgi:transglutaminase-like putative cysteine protease
MNRRHFLRSAGVATAWFSVSKTKHLFAQGPQASSWRTFEVTTRVEVLKTSGTTRIWVPAALISESPFQKTLSNTFKAEGGTVRNIESQVDGLGIIAAEFPSEVKPVLLVTSRIATKNCSVDLSAPGNAPKETQAELQHFLRTTKLLPTDGIVKEAALEITKGAKTDLEKARAIYE